MGCFQGKFIHYELIIIKKLSDFNLHVNGNVWVKLYECKQKEKNVLKQQKQKYLGNTTSPKELESNIIFYKYKCISSKYNK